MRLVNGWSGGQYSVYRALLGLYLLVHLSALLPYGTELFSNAGMLADAAASPLYPLFPNLLFVCDGPAVVAAALAVGVLASACLALGWRDRVAALVLWLLWASLFTRNPLIQNPGLPFIGWLLLAHALLPAAPYGSWAARGRADPAGGWHLPPQLFAAAWIVMALGYSYSGYSKLVSPSWLDGSALARVLENPLARPIALREALLALPAPLLSAATWGALALELLFAPLALLRRVRPWLWLAMLGMHLGLMVLVDFADLSLGMLILHAFTFDPAWVPARASEGRVLYYDGDCGLCHRAVRLVLAEDRAASLRFAPLEGEHFRSRVPLDQRNELPDSLVLGAQDGSLAVRSDALIAIGDGLGGLWRVLATLARALPRPLRDRLYDGVARLRGHLFARPEAACPLLTPALRTRFFG